MASILLRTTAAAAAAVISLLIGFAALSVQDTQSMATVRSALVIAQANEATPITPLLRAEAQRHHANFYRIRMDPTGETTTRTLAPIIGDRTLYDRAFPSGTYARFDKGMVTELVPLDGAASGGYLSTMSFADLHQVVVGLEDRGIEAHAQSLGWWSLLRYMVGYTPAVMAAGVAVLAAFTMGFARAARRARRSALALTLGARAPLIGDLVTSAALSVAAFVVLGGVAAVVLLPYNGGHRLPDYYEASALMLGLLFAAFAGGSCISGVLPAGERFRAAFTGWRPWARGSVPMSVVQVFALTLVVFLLTQAVAAAGALQAVHGSRPDWRACETCTSTIFQGVDGPDALDAAVAPFASAVRTRDDAAGVVLSWVPGRNNGDRFMPGDPGSNVIVANPEFIVRSGSRLSDPLRGAHGPGIWGILVPDDHADRADSIASEWRRWFASPLGDVPNEAVPKAPRIGTYSAGKVFNYGQTDFRSQVFSDSPVIVIVPASAGLLDDDSYFAAGSAGDLLFTEDVGGTRQVLDDAGVSRSVYVLDSLANQMARGEEAAAVKLPIAMVGGVIGLLVMLGVLVIRTRSYMLIHRDRVLSGLVHGQSLARVHLPLWGRTVLLLSCAALTILVGMRSGLTGADILPFPLGVTFGVVAGVISASSIRIAGGFTTTKELRAHAE
ncbi:hypothetical protein ACO0E1_13380 [Curtobacterium sp. RRHDQ66]|uniref:hypothetical protein n=1 Tax=Curtobacterium guangdongense TaxID=3413380 RepID=UPI003BF32FE2